MKTAIRFTLSLGAGIVALIDSQILASTSDAAAQQGD